MKFNPGNALAAALHIEMQGWFGSGTMVYAGLVQGVPAEAKSSKVKFLTKSSKFGSVQ